MTTNDTLRGLLAEALDCMPPMFSLPVKYYGSTLGDRIRAALAAPDSGEVVMPPLDADLRSILGRPNFACGHMATRLRDFGQAIPYKAEAEQAAVIYWLLGVFLKHGDQWASVANAELNKAPAKAEPEVGCDHAPCPECGQKDCNGECFGDDMMGDS